MSDNELYTTKLMKEKSQLQERVTSLEEQSIKETSSIGQQFNYLEEEQLEKSMGPSVENNLEQESLEKLFKLSSLPTTMLEASWIDKIVQTIAWSLVRTIHFTDK